MRLPALILLAASFLLTFPPRSGWAEEQEEERRQFVVRPELYERLVKAQKALDAKEYEESIKQTRIIRNRMKPNPHEEALTLQVLGYVYAAQEKLKLAAETLDQAYALDSLPKATQLSMLFTIGQILLAAKDFKGAVERFDLWLELTDKPNPQALYTIAAAKYQAKDMQGAAKYAARAVRASKNPKDSWLQLQMSAHIELKQWRPAIEVMKVLVERHPDKRTNWLQLVGLYGEVNDEERALAVIQLAQQAGVFEKKDDFKQYAQRLQAKDIHYRAAQFLEGAVKDKKLDLDPEVAKMIAESYFVAREHESAARWLNRAGSMATDGELYVRLAQLHVEREAWAKAVEAGRKALKKGDLRSPGKVHLLIGIAESRRGRTASARSAFKAATEFPATRRSAEGWMKFLSSAGTPVTGAGSGSSPE